MILTIFHKVGDSVQWGPKEKRKTHNQALTRFNKMQISGLNIYHQRKEGETPITYMDSWNRDIP